MNNTLTTLTHLINSPPGQLAAGGVLAGIVWKFFERVEAVLTDQTKLEIAVWLVGVKVGQKIEPWPETFAKVFDRVFGKKHLSWKCFGTSCLATTLSCSLCTLLSRSLVSEVSIKSPMRLAVSSAVFLFVFDYLSLLETRLVLFAVRQCRSGL